ncbi:hypothetical protein N7456_000550 [Penicillium angulare]|uniref:Uncharacterized protein n=1 Tax=Penicillium angulare TaxID=116970 RepID=A0A9W9GCC4_9EURO|nr:hypothetical protein N7456_000550 [Penicillium angulare]
MALEALYTSFCDLRSQMVSKLTNWRQAVTNQELTAKTLSFNLLSLANHMDKSFLKSEIINSPTISTCYRSRVGRIINTILTTVESLQDSEEIVFTESGTLSGIIGLVIVQIGRLSILSPNSEIVDGNAIEMDMMADIVEAQVGLGVFECVDESMIDEQCLLKEIWEWMHDVDPLCECAQCLNRNSGELSTEIQLGDASEPLNEEFEMTDIIQTEGLSEDPQAIADMDIDLWSPVLFEGSGEELEMTDVNIESCLWSPNQVLEDSSEGLQVDMTDMEIESWLPPLCNFDMDIDSWSSAFVTDDMADMMESNT